jgi:hypothetical protein
MTVRFLATCALKDLRRLLRDPAALAMWVGIPVLVSVLLFLVFGSRGEATPQGRLLVADEDGSFLSTFLAGAFGQGELGNMLTTEKVSQADGHRRMNRGDASALLVIPKGFGQAVLDSRACQLTLVKNPSQRILPGMIEEIVSGVVEAGFYLQALAGDQLKLFAGGPPAGATTFPDETIIRTSVAFNRLGERLSAYLDPPVIQLKTTVVETQGPARMNFAALYFPSMLFMTVLFAVLGLSGDAWEEHRQGALRRLLGTPGGLGPVLAGKVFAATAVLLLVAVAAMACARWLMNIPVTNPTAAVLWTALSGAVLLLMMVLLQLCASSQRTANILAFLVVFPLGMLGGGFFPFEFMPEWMARIGRLTPNGYALVQLRALLEGPAPLARVATGFVALAAVGAALFPLALWRLRRISVT